MIEVILINEIGKIEPGQWYASLSMFPSQCYRWEKKDGVDYILYLRWRWDDPWQAHIIKGADSIEAMQDGEWSDNLFTQDYFTHDDYKKAQDKLVEIFGL